MGAHFKLTLPNNCLSGQINNVIFAFDGEKFLGKTTVIIFEGVFFSHGKYINSLEL